MLTHVERKHWYTQLPFSWGVEVLLVILLLAGTTFAALQVRDREARMANQAAMLEAAQVQQVETVSRMNATVTQQEEFRAQLEQGLVMQAAVIEQQAMTLQQSEEQVATLRRVAAVDSELIEAYGTLQTQRVAMTEALRGEYGEVYEAYAVAAAGEQQALSRIELLLAQRQVILTASWTYDR